MKRGYILALSLKLLIIVSGIFLITYNQVITTNNIYKESNFIYARLEAEKFIFDEILYRLYIYDYDSFLIIYKEFDFDVKMGEQNIIVSVSHDDQYQIKLAYDDDCLCFTEILYK